MKIILVSGCCACPHGAAFNIEFTQYICSKLMKVNNEPKEPLPDCPLDDAMEVIKDIIKPK